MIDRSEKTKGMIDAERKMERAKELMKAAKRQKAREERKKRQDYKLLIGSIVYKYFPASVQYDKDELEQIIAAAMTSKQCEFAMMKIHNQNDAEYQELIQPHRISGEELEALCRKLGEMK
jgi:hypothetical protein